MLYEKVFFFCYNRLRFRRLNKLRAVPNKINLMHFLMYFLSKTKNIGIHMVPFYFN